jgi:plastocyanin
MEGFQKKLIGAVAALALFATSSGIKADEFVDVDFFGFSPQTVNIFEGEAVFWLCVDDFGPYSVTSSSGAWSEGLLFDDGDFFGLLFSEAGTYDYFDRFSGEFGTVAVAVNHSPVVEITSPPTNAVFNAPASFEFTAEATDQDFGSGALSDVEFFINGTEVDDVFFPPFTTSVTDLPPGSYQLTVIAWDFLNATATNSISITVQAGGPIALTSPSVASGQFRFNASGLTTGKTNILQSSTNLASGWISVATNVAASASASYTNSAAGPARYFRLLQLP